jgi:hypothetical protein
LSQLKFLLPSKACGEEEAQFETDGLLAGLLQNNNSLQPVAPDDWLQG